MMKRYQRGIFGVVSLLANVIIWGVIAAAVMGILYGAYDALGDHFRDPILAKWAPLITQCGKRTPEECATEWTSAIANNKSLAESARVLSEAAGRCSKGVEHGGELTKAAEDDKARRLAVLEPKLAASRQLNAQLEQQLAAQSTVRKTCDQEMAAVKGGLVDLARQRIRFALGFDPAPPAEPGAAVEVGK